MRKLFRAVPAVRRVWVSELVHEAHGRMNRAAVENESAQLVDAEETQNRADDALFLLCSRLARAGPLVVAA
jgi:hypothetical protein